ncbi:MAG: hypothetical protein K9I68_11780 [Bacteroidales bacterium]|nr:hypothetical protein [Bacteroidales bacterium]MCF8338528.1 hypothetical protein [Bacteroidales bacterium]
MEKKKQISQDLHDELVRLFGDEQAQKLMEDKGRSKSSLQYLAFKKQFRRNFGINFNVILVTFIVIVVFLISLEILGL